MKKLPIIIFLILGVSPAVIYGQKIVDYNFSTISQLCPNTKQHSVSGGRHFDGKVDATLITKIYVTNDHRDLKLDLDLEMKGVSRNTTLKAKWSFLLLRTVGDRIQGLGLNRWGSFVNQIVETQKIRLPEGGFEAKPFSYHDGHPKEVKFSSSFIESITLIGDTGTEDISNDNNCLHDSKIVNIRFRRGYVKLIPDGLPLNLTVKSGCQLLYNRYQGYTSASNRFYESPLSEDIFHKNTGYDSYHWEFQKIEKEPFFYLYHSATGNYLAMNKNRVYFSNKRLNSDELKWRIEEIHGLPHFFRIQNKGVNWYLHREKGKLDKVKSPGGWWSAMWQQRKCESPLSPKLNKDLSCTVIGLKSSNEYHYLDESLRVVKNGFNQSRSDRIAIPQIRWSIEQRNGGFLIKNTNSGKLLIHNNNKISLAFPRNIKGNLSSAIWYLESTYHRDTYRIKNSENMYIKAVKSSIDHPIGITLVPTVDRTSSKFEFVLNMCVQNGLL